MTNASQGPAFNTGDSVRVKQIAGAGVSAGKTGKIVRVLPSQATNLGKANEYAYKTDIGPEFFRVGELERA